VPSLRIDPRFCGPPNSGNGGYVAGLVAKALGGSDCVVTLMLPPPLGRDLDLSAADGTAHLTEGERVVATGVCEAAKVDVPPPPGLPLAAEAEQRFTGLARHNFPTCFVCGPERRVGDGLRIFAGLVEGAASQVAATWLPDASLLDEEGRVRTEFVWAALDCPGYFAVEQVAGRAVLGRLGVVLHEPRIEPKRMVVTGWPIASSGRKHFAGTALHDERGRLLAAAAATWISLRD
jgi:hypothetical protein